MKILDILLGEFRFYRRMRGHRWARSTKISATGRGPWMIHEPIDEAAFNMLVSYKWFECEDYRK